MALSGEVGELTELFQWLTPAQSAQASEHPAEANRIMEELADVFGYLLRLADVLDIDLEEALREKVASCARLGHKIRRIGRWVVRRSLSAIRSGSSLRFGAALQKAPES